MHPWMLVETTHVTEFEYYFACPVVKVVFESRVTWATSVPILVLG